MGKLILEAAAPNLTPVTWIGEVVGSFLLVSGRVGRWGLGFVKVLGCFRFFFLEGLI